MIANRWHSIAQTTVFDSGCGISITFGESYIVFTASVRYGVSSLNISSCYIQDNFLLSIRLRETDSKWHVDLICNVEIIPVITITDSPYWNDDNNTAGAGTVLTSISDISYKFNTQKGVGTSLFEKVNIGTENNPIWALRPKRIDDAVVGIITDSFITSGGVNGKGAGEATISLGQIVNVEAQADDLFDIPMTLVKKAGDTHFSIMEYSPKADDNNPTAGLDEAALKKYLDLYNYLKKIDADKLYADLEEFKAVKAFVDLFEVDANGDIHIKDNKGLYTESFLTSGGVNSSAQTGASFIRLDDWNNYNEGDGAVLSAVLGYDLKELTKEIEAKYNTLSTGTDGKINSLIATINALRTAYETFNQQVHTRLEELESLWGVDDNALYPKNGRGVYTNSFLTSGGKNGADVEAVERLDNWDDYSSQDGSVLSAQLGYDLYTRLMALERENKELKARLEQ
jgi:hypothetical protein